MEGRPQLDRTYLPTPATTAEMYLNAMLDILVQIRDQQPPKAPSPPAGEIPLREPASPPGPAQRDAPDWAKHDRQPPKRRR